MPDKPRTLALRAMTLLCLIAPAVSTAQQTPPPLSNAPEAAPLATATARSTSGDRGKLITLVNAEMLPAQPTGIVWHAGDEAPERPDPIRQALNRWTKVLIQIWQGWQGDASDDYATTATRTRPTAAETTARHGG
jgi:hypothetical protein